MDGLLDAIFLSLDLNNLSRKEVEDHLLYLEEIITKDLSLAHQVRFLKYKVQLNRRLVYLDQIQLQNLQQQLRAGLT